MRGTVVSTPLGRAYMLRERQTSGAFLWDSETRGILKRLFPFLTVSGFVLELTSNTDVRPRADGGAAPAARLERVEHPARAVAGAD